MDLIAQFKNSRTNRVISLFPTDIIITNDENHGMFNNGNLGFDVRTLSTGRIEFKLDNANSSELQELAYNMRDEYSLAVLDTNEINNRSMAYDRLVITSFETHQNHALYNDNMHNTEPVDFTLRCEFWGMTNITLQVERTRLETKEDLKKVNWKREGF